MMISEAFRSTLAAVLLAASTTGAQAAVVTWNFSGEVTLDTNSPFSLGDTVTGSFSYESLTPISSGTATTAVYAGAVRGFSIDGLASLSSSDAGVTTNFIEIWDGNPGTGSVQIDRFWSQLRDTSAPQNWFELNMQRGVNGSNPTCIGSLSLPDSPYAPLSCFNNATVTYDYITAAGTAGSIKLRLTIGDFPTVPEPGVLALLGLGLVGVALGHRRKRS